MQVRSSLRRSRVIGRSAPLFVTLLAIGIFYYIVAGQFSLGSRGLIFGLIVLLVPVLVVAIQVGHTQINRSVSLILLALVTIAEAVSTTGLIVGLIFAPVRMSEVTHDTALLLLRDATLTWLINVLVFSVWYWELDGGGPLRRHHLGYQSVDFIFPQQTYKTTSEEAWVPHFVDYLFLSFNTSTAFSPTDTQVLSVRAKLLMMLQSLLSLIVLAVLAARAINTL